MGTVVAKRKVPHVGVHGDGVRLVEAEKSNAGGDLPKTRDCGKALSCRCLSPPSPPSPLSSSTEGALPERAGAPGWPGADGLFPADNDRAAQDNSGPLKRDPREPSHLWADAGEGLKLCTGLLERHCPQALRRQERSRSSPSEEVGEESG